jgi:hypothetical protein
MLVKDKAKVTLQTMVSRPVYIGVKHTSGVKDQIFISQTVAGFVKSQILSYFTTDGLPSIR